MFARGRTCGCGGRKGRRGVSLPWRWKSPTVYRHSSPGPHSWSVAGPTRRAERPGRAHTRGAVNRPKSASQQTPTVRTQTTPEGDLKGWHEDRSRRNPLTWRQEGLGNRQASLGHTPPSLSPDSDAEDAKDCAKVDNTCNQIFFIN